MAQSPQSSSARVLCVSTDPLLRSTRHLVLSLRYVMIAIATVAEMRVFAGETFDAVVLCHTLTTQECDTAVQLALQQWPRVEIIVLARASTETACVRNADKVIRTAAGPEFLLDSIDHLLQPHAPKQASQRWTLMPPVLGRAAGGA